MAEVIIKLTDEVDGTVDYHMEFNPPVDRDPKEYTPSQRVASDFIGMLSKYYEIENTKGTS